MAHSVKDHYGRRKVSVVHSENFRSVENSGVTVLGKGSAEKLRNRQNWERQGFSRARGRFWSGLRHDRDRLRKNLALPFADCQAKFQKKRLDYFSESEKFATAAPLAGTVIFFSQVLGSVKIGRSTLFSVRTSNEDPCFVRPHPSCHATTS
jgi:hypothetical protein